MPSVSVSSDVQKGRSVSSSGSFDGLISCLGHFDRIHSVHGKRRHVIAQPQFVYVMLVGGPFHRSSHCITVVFTNKYHRQFPVHRHIESLVQNTLSGSSVTKKTYDNTFPAIVLFAKCNTGTQRNLTANDTVTAIKIMFLVKNVHRSAQTK